MRSSEVQANIKLMRHERAMMRADAREFGLSLAKFPALLWRNWRIERRPLHPVPPYPDPEKAWKGPKSEE